MARPGQEVEGASTMVLEQEASGAQKETEPCKKSN